ncbi:hypothetical protein IC575_029999 [Cucumis melo]
MEDLRVFKRRRRRLSMRQHNCLHVQISRDYTSNWPYFTCSWSRTMHSLLLWVTKV